MSPLGGQRVRSAHCARVCRGPFLLGVKAVIAITFERIHRSNLVGMGVLPLQFKDGDDADKLGLTGFETFTIGVCGACENERESVC